jgi:hypothetical protein
LQYARFLKFDTMASTETAKVTEEVPPTGDNKPSSTHYENAEAGVKVTDFEGERVIVTQQDVSSCP